MKNGNVYVDSEDNVEKHLQQLKELLKDPKCKLDILPRKKDEAEDDPYTTENTMQMLNYDSGDVRRELLTLSTDDYIENMKDDRHPNTPDFRVFEKTLNGFQIYIKEKIRSTKGVFCVSFHRARYHLKDRPYKSEN